MAHAGAGEGWQDMRFPWPFCLKRFDVTSQLGGDAMIFVDSKTETFLHGHAYNPSTVVKSFPLTQSVG